MGEQSFDELLSRETLRAAAGDTCFARGEDYFEQELVERLRVLAGVITAKVQGTETYQVRIALSKSGLDFDCACPLGDDGAVCEHCVAVGLARIGMRRSSLHRDGVRPQSDLSTRSAVRSGFGRSRIRAWRRRGPRCRDAGPPHDGCRA